ncbi:MAG: hypothetical protein U0527_05435 [Candidatus Eisenbacteria bacterium]
MRVLNRSRWLLLAWLALPARAVAARGGDGAVEIVEVVPARSESLLVCTLRLRGLPDSRARETLASGLPSALVIGFTLFNSRGHDLLANRVEVRLEPELLGSSVAVRTPLWRATAPDLGLLDSLLTSLGPLPVCSLRSTPEGTELKLRAELAIHPLAPAEAAWAQDVLSGGSSEASLDRHEVSIGVGALVRYFLGVTEQERWVTRAVSAPFHPLTLPEAEK